MLEVGEDRCWRWGGEMLEVEEDRCWRSRKTDAEQPLLNKQTTEQLFGILWDRKAAEHFRYFNYQSNPTYRTIES